MSSPPLAGESDGKYGPRTAVVEAVIDRAGRLTAQEARALDDAWYAAEDADWAGRDARVAVRAAAVAVGRDDVVVDAREDAVAAARVAARNAGYAAYVDAHAAGDAAVAAVVTDLAGEHGLTREHLVTLVEPWCQTVTDVDPLMRQEPTMDDGHGWLREALCRAAGCGHEAYRAWNRHAPNCMQDDVNLALDDLDRYREELERIARGSSTAAIAAMSALRVDSSPRLKPGASRLSR